MKKPSIPSNENERIKALKTHEILDTLPEQAYDDITKIAAQICGTPISLVSLIDEHRQWFKSHHGLDVQETPRELAYCAHAINEPEKILEVPDAYKDDRFHDNPLATGDPYVRFYAGAPLTDDEGHTFGTLCVIDHKERHLTKEQKESLWALSRQVVSLLKLRKENTKRNQMDEDFTNMLENLADGVFELDENGKCNYANSQMLQMLGRNLEEVIETSIWDMIYFKDIPGMQAYYANQFRSKSKRCSYEFRLHSKNGETIWVSQNTSMEYEGSRMFKLRSIARNMSENKKLRKELEKKETLYRLVSENSSDLIALHEPDGTYKYVSLASKDLLGYNPSELIGKNPYSLMHPDDVKKLEKGAHQATLKGNEVQQIEYRIKKKNGDYIWLESYTKPILDEAQKVTSFQTSSRDISIKRKEREQLEIAKTKAEEASDAKASFLSMMSHEIRTPLNGIIGTTHLLLDKDPKEDQKPHLTILKQTSDNLLAIVNDILDFNKIEEGKIELNESSFNLNTLLKTIHSNYSIQASEKQVRVSLDIDQELAERYTGDAVRISQILHNLMSNALKFTEEGDVSLNLTKTNQHDNFDEINFEIIDSGIGISDEKQVSIFNVFEQSEKNTTTKYGGSGLGLSITKRLLELMDSEIVLESQLDKGSSFSFKLILPREEQQIKVTKDPEMVKFSNLDARVLVVEDNAFNMTIAKEFLSSWGCQTKEAVNGKIALEILEMKDVDLVLLDLHMPVMDGFETIREIRSKDDAFYKELPVVALSAEALGDVRYKVFKAGINDFISKPFLPDEFYLKIATQLTKEKEIVDETDLLSHIENKLIKTLGRNKDIGKLVSVFIDNAEEERQLLKESIVSQSLIDLRKYAHKNKTSYKLLGLNKLLNQAHEIEEMIKRKNPLDMILRNAEQHHE
ncbi:MAG: PAS domain S-box protein, partial [Ekhidna sp.]